MPANRYARLLSVFFVLALLPGLTGFNTLAQPDLSQGSQVAYIGEDANVWLVSMESNEVTQITTDGFQYYRNHINWDYYIDPAWSHDGTMLAFASPEHLSGHSIHYWDGETVNAVPGTRGCVYPQFSPDSQRIYFTCDSYYQQVQESPNPNEPDPEPSILSSVRLDGSDFRVEIPDILTDPNPMLDPNFGHVFFDIDSATGNLLFASFGGDTDGFTIVSPAGEVISDGVVPLQGSLDLLGLIFNNQGTGVLAAWCSADCGFAETPGRAHHVSEFDLEGVLIQHFPALDTNLSFAGVGSGTSEGELVAALRSGEDVPTIVYHSPNGELSPIGRGKYPTIQPEYSPSANPQPTQTPAPTPAPEPTATSVAQQKQLPALDLPTEEIVVAYIGEDGNVWIADLSNQEKTQVTTDGFFSPTDSSNYNNPEWSPDGSKLTFHIYPWGNDESILWWDGETVHTIPGTRNCVNPHFNPAGDRLLFTCPDFVDFQALNPPDADAEPRAAIVTSVKLDGTDMRAEIRYVNDGPTGIHWNPGGARLKDASLSDVDPVTGNMLVSGYEYGPIGWTIFAPDGTRLLEGLGEIIGKNGPFQEQFVNGNQTLLVRICDNDCAPSSTSISWWLLKVDLDGNILSEYPTLEGAAGIFGFAGVPGTDFVIVSVQVSPNTPPYLLLVSPTSDPAALELGREPAVRPTLEEPAQ